MTLDTVSVAETATLSPPGPLHVSEYVVVAPTVPVVRVPPAPSAPLQPPDAAHALALLELQPSVAEPPGATTEGWTESSADGTRLTVAVAAGLVPPAPEQVIVYVVAAFTAPVDREPLAASEPVQPPEAVQELALSELQFSVEEPPGATLVGEAVRLAVGTGGSGSTVTVATAGGLAPPGPEHVNENVEFAVRVPVVREPLVASVPLQLPAAVHAVE